MKFLLLFLSSLAFGQGAQATLFDGTQLIVEGAGSQTSGIAKLSVIEYSPGRWRAEILNTGRPRWIVGARVDGEDLFLDSVMLWAPERFTVKHASERQIPPAAPFKHPATGEPNLLWAALWNEQRTDAHPRVPQSADQHYLEGGTALVWDIVPVEDPAYPLPTASAKRAMQWLGFAESRPHERLVRLREIMTASGDSVNLKATNRDLGWLLYNWTARFAGNRRPDNRGPYAWPGLVWTEGHSNLDYAPEADCVRRWLDKGDRFAWELAYALLTHKVSQGLYRCEANVNTRGRWAYEKSSVLGRPGDYRFPEPSHEWDEGLLMVAHLSGDPWLLEAAEIRRKACLEMALPNTRNAGARRPGWFLRNLRAHMHFTPSPALLAKAGNVVQSQFAAIKPGEFYIKNDWANPAAGDIDPWQEALLYGEVLRWHQDFGLPLPPRFDELCRWNIENGTSIRVTSVGPALEGHYTQFSKTGAFTAPWPSTAAFWLPLLHHYREDYRDKYAACITAAHGLAFQGWTSPQPLSIAEAQADCSGYGSAGRKTMSQILRMSEDRYLQ